MPELPNIKVLYIGAMGRSGSTLLGRLLGSFSGYTHVGEIDAIWQRWDSDSIRCGCGCVFRECAFWQEVVGVAFGPLGCDVTARILQARALFLSPRHYPSLLLTGKVWGHQEPLQEYRQALGRLYRAIATVSGARVIIDTTKSPVYGYLLQQVPGIDLRFVHLVRDSRAVAFSWQRRKLTPAFVEETYMWRFSWAKSARHWNIRNSLFEMRRPGHRALQLRYEDMVTAMPAALTRIFEMLEEPAQPLGYLDLQPFVLEAEHTAGGNPDRYNPAVSIRPDTEWRVRMPGMAKLLVTAATFPLLAYYGYVPRRTGTRAQ